MIDGSPPKCCYCCQLMSDVPLWDQKNEIFTTVFPPDCLFWYLWSTRALSQIVPVWCPTLDDAEATQENHEKKGFHISRKTNDMRVTAVCEMDCNALPLIEPSPRHQFAGGACSFPLSEISGTIQPRWIDGTMTFYCLLKVMFSNEVRNGLQCIATDWTITETSIWRGACS